MLGRYLARTGLEAVNAAERLICGADAVHSVAEAQGLALAGRRSATLLPVDLPPGATVAECPVSGSWVLHRETPGPGVAEQGMTFELVASTAQEAVDHCVVAHRLAARLHVPGVCTLDAELAQKLDLVQLPPVEVVADLAVEGGGRPERAGFAPARVLEAAQEAFAFASKHTGRPCTPVETYRLDDATHVIVACGAASALAIEIADDLRREGVSCGVLTLLLVRPFPGPEVDRLLEGKRQIAVVERAFSPAEKDRLSSGVLAVETRDPSAHVHSVMAAAGSPVGLDAAVRRTFGLDARPGASPSADSPAAEAVTLGIAPQGPWSEGLLLDTVAWLGDLGRPRFERTPASSGFSALTVSNGSPGRPERDGLDVLLAAHPALLEPDGALSAVREGGVIVLTERAASPEALWFSLGEKQRRTITERGLRLRWIEPSAAEMNGARPEEPDRARLQGALLRAAGGLSRLLGVDEPDVLTAIERGPDTTELLREGAESMQVIDPESLDESRLKGEQDFHAEHHAPRMPQPAPAAGSGAVRWREALHEFHLTGRGAFSGAESLPAMPLEPALLAGLGAAESQWSEYPLLLSEGETAGRSFHAVIERTLEAMEQAGEQAPIVRRNLPHLVATLARTASAHARPSSAASIVAETWDAFENELDLSESGRAALTAELDHIKPRLPVTGNVIGLGPRTLVDLYVSALGAARRPRRRAFLEEAGRLVERIEELLAIDDAMGPAGSSPDTLSKTLGGKGSQWFDPSRLSDNLPAARGSRPLDPGRRGRMEAVRETLCAAMDDLSAEPEAIWIHDGVLDAVTSIPPANRILHPQAMQAAIGLFDGLARKGVPTFRAMRIARLEVDGEYSPELHDPVMARFDWESLDPDELLVLPAVVVVETAQRLRRKSLGSFSDLLRSSRPVHVLIQDLLQPMAADEDHPGHYPALGYLAAAHREAFVLQSTLVDPGHLVRGLCRLAETARPAAAWIAVPDWSSPVDPWLQLAARREGRATPCFVYDADSGESWAERFDLSANPQHELDWPRGRFDFVDTADAMQSREEAFTFAHAAALDPAWRQHLRVIPEGAWSDDQVEVAEYLAPRPPVASDDEPPPESPEEQVGSGLLQIQPASGDRPSPVPPALREKIPYIWIVNRAGTLARAVISRELVFACADRRRAWRILQELAGTNNQHARRAAESARQDALAEFEQQREGLEAAHAEELERVRRDTAQEAMQRLAGVLLNPDGLPDIAVPAPAASVVPAVDSTPAPGGVSAGAVAEQPEPEPEEEALSFNDPYIDSVLCTTCHECTNINPQLFKYNENKQAFIADAAAGTFDQLVRAAEKCPARCIHPGAPRGDDATASEELVARAASFN